jgi:hypothetical protein
VRGPNFLSCPSAAIAPHGCPAVKRTMGKDFAARHAVYVGAAVVLKLICGADDCVWLSPFLAKARGAAAKAKVGCKYVCTVVLITCVAAGLALAIRRIAAPAERRADEGIGTAAGVLLVLYAMYVAREDGWFPCCPPDEEEESVVADALTKLSACCDCMEDEEEPLLKTAEERRSERDILVVAFLGTMDDLVVYFSVAVSGKIPGVDLVIGTTVGAVALAFCVGSLLECSERASACVAKVPIPLVLVALACYIIVDAWHPLKY